MAFASGNAHAHAVRAPCDRRLRGSARARGMDVSTKGCLRCQALQRLSRNLSFPTRFQSGVLLVFKGRQAAARDLSSEGLVRGWKF